MTFLWRTLVFLGLFFAQTHTAFAEKKVDHIDFDIQLIAEYPSTANSKTLKRVYIAQEKNAYLKKLGDEIGIHTLIITDSNEYLIVDPGPDGAYAHRLINQLKKIEPELKQHPQAIVNTVARPEHTLANSTIANKNTLILASSTTQNNMRERCPNCRKRLSNLLKNKKILATPILTPNTLVQAGNYLLTNFPEWQVLEFEGRTASDLVLWNKEMGIFYAGGLVSSQSIPDLSDASLSGWIKALEQLKQLNPKTIIGVGPYQQFSNHQSVSDLDFTLEYLKSLEILVRTDFIAGGDAANADKCLNLEHFSSLPGYKRLHPLNVQHVWREIELEEMNK